MDFLFFIWFFLSFFNAPWNIYIIVQKIKNTCAAISWRSLSPHGISHTYNGQNKDIDTYTMQEKIV